MDKFQFEQRDVKYLIECVDTILKSKGIEENKYSVLAYRNEQGDLLGIDGGTVYNIFIREKRPIVTKKILGALKKSVEDYFKTASASEIAKLKGFSQDSFERWYKKLKEVVVLNDLEKKNKNKVDNGTLKLLSINTKLPVGEAVSRNGGQELIKSIILKFYQGIGSADYSIVWNLLSTTFQDKLPCKGNYKDFEKGFANTRGISEIHFLKTEQLSDILVECTVYYEVMISVFSCTELSSMQSCNGSDIEKFVDNYNILKEKIEEAGGKNFNSIPLNKLLEPTASEHIWFRCQLEPSILAQIFNIKNTMAIRRLVTCSCKFIEDKWLINDIRSHSAQAVR